MRILSALVLTYCFGCVIAQDLDDAFMQKSPIIKGNSNVQIISFTGCSVENSNDNEDRSIRYDHGDTENRTPSNNKLTSSMNSVVIYHELPRYWYISGFLQTQKERSIDFLPERSTSVSTRKTAGQANKMRSKLWHRNQPREARASSCTDSGQSKAEKWRIPLRVNSRHILAERRGRAQPECYSRDEPHGRHNLNGQYTSCNQLKKNLEVRNAERLAREDDWEGDDENTAEDTEDTETDPGEWDEWTEWSECSVSCGCGRQVRWRHCVGGRCMAGLKKAQIRICHLRDCNNKNLLSWFGMKT